MGEGYEDQTVMVNQASGIVKYQQAMFHQMESDLDVLPKDLAFYEDGTSPYYRLILVSTKQSVATLPRPEHPELLSL